MDIPATIEDKIRIETSMTWEERGAPPTIYSFLTACKDENGDSNAVTFQIFSDAKSKSETLTWSELHGKATQAANLFRFIGCRRKRCRRLPAAQLQ